MNDLPPPYKGYPEHRYIYSTEDGDSCSCGWVPTHFRMGGQAEWDAHVDAAEMFTEPTGLQGVEHWLGLA